VVGCVAKGCCAIAWEFSASIFTREVLDGDHDGHCDKQETKTQSLKA
jgi:hypothetical protein